ncbi:MAG: phosphodiester glycosidase family protein [Cyanobacteriota bacterium]|nr:phosphodiester glycosidase family protein [Cyanobacteriota bacterium]
MAGLGTALSLASLLGLAALPVPLPPPVTGQPPPPLPSGTAAGSQGSALVINGRSQTARWLWVGGEQRPHELWLPLEVLQGQLGFSSSAGSDGTLQLEWFGLRHSFASGAQRSLDDEVAVEVAGLLEQRGVRLERRGAALTLELPPLPLSAVRSGPAGGSQRRVVLDLSAAGWLRQEEAGLWVGVQSDPAQRSQLAALGLVARQEPAGLRLQPAAGTAIARSFTLGEPLRVVLDLQTAPPGAASATAAPAIDRAAIAAQLGPDLQWQWESRKVAGRAVLINSVRLDPRTAPLGLQPLVPSGGMEGLSSLSQLARQERALVAINGGYFNRVRRLPLGAVRQDGRWLSGPILNRGVVAWSLGQLPRFGRLSLQEWLEDGQGRRTPLVTVNSGYVQRGYSRYTADWGPGYRALSGNETGLLLQADRVMALLEAPQLAAGIGLRPGEQLIVARGGVSLPWQVGDRLAVGSSPSNDLGLEPFVIGGGPLLLASGRVVLDGGAESFGATFLQQGAPRTVVASDGRQLWLITLQSGEGGGPSLPETAQLLLGLGLRDALNLDGGSSTGLVLAGQHLVKGRGVAGSVHHALGLVPLAGRSPGPQAAVPLPE